MKRAAILLAFLFLGCEKADPGKPQDPTTIGNSNALGCQVCTFEGRKFGACDTLRGGTMAPLDACK